jgi:membrane-associated protease RseP (regulator of RpoE activity)
VDWLAIVGFVVFIVGLMVSIALHEIGHLVPAKLFGIRVTQYMVGFGSTVWSRKRGETEYGIKAIPLGGYIRMIGMFPPLDSSDPTKLRQSSTGLFQNLVNDARTAATEEVGPDDADRVFYRKAWWKKAIVMLGGPMMNVVLALLLAGTVLMTFGNPDKPVLVPTVGAVSECMIPADEPARACTEDDPATPAAAAGLKPGDELVAIDGEEITSWAQTQQVIRALPEQPVDIEIIRDGRPDTISVDIAVTERPTLDGDPENPTYEAVGFLGVVPTVVDYETEDIGGVVAWSGTFITRTAEAMAHIPERMGAVWDAAFGGQDRDPNTPVSIVGAGRIGGDIVTTDALTTQEKISTFVLLLASFNMAIAIFNLVPLLPLDGGHVAGALWEGLKRAFARVARRPEPKPVDVAKALPLAYGVALVLVCMSALLIYADIVNPIRLVE